MTVAALFVEEKGVYSGLADVEVWGVTRDARLYAGPHPCVAHPPCQRWSMLANVVQKLHPHMRVGDNGGCFASALHSVRTWGGVLEHPAESMAWPAHNLSRPGRAGWQYDMHSRGWTREVAQSAYGHRARKRTWLFYCGETPPPPLAWEKPKGQFWVSWMAKDTSPNRPPGMPKKERHLTPIPFRDLLISIARTAQRRAA